MMLLASSKFYAGVDTQLGAVFCRECQDVIYEPTLDDLYQKLVRGVEERETKHLGTLYLSSILRKDFSSGKLKSR
jgi:hypothetical protein